MKEVVPNISVIIPIYNAGKYVEKCLESITHQTYQDIEIIIVNDGSTDNSREICERYARKDNRITLINTENRGAGSARNTGIEKAKGKYISFIDSDDYICNDYYERLYSMIQKSGADIAVGRYQRISEHETMHFVNTGEVQEYTSIQELLILYGEDEDKYVNAVLVTNKLFNRELFGDDIRYPLHRIIDDEFIIYKLIDRSKKIVCTDDVMYAYVQSDSSVMRANFKEKRVYDTIDAYDEVYEFFKDKNQEELIEKILIRYLGYCVELAQKTSKSDYIEDKTKIYQYLNDKFTEKSQVAINKIDSMIYENLYQEFHKVIDN